MPLDVENITYIYSKGQPEETKALDDVSFSVSDGEFLAVIGHTGSGKSTLLQILDGLIKPESGSITVNGTVITDEKTRMVDVRRKIGLLFQYPEYQLFEDTVAEDVAFGPKNLGLDEEEIKKRVREALLLTGLDPDEVGEKSPFDLSGGQKRRAAIAGILAMKPEILILDEPTAGLDPAARKDLLDMISKVHEREGNITLLVSHNMDDVAKTADKVLVMDSGRAVMFGTPKDVFSRAEELESIGLGVPHVTDLIRRLDRRGFHIDESIFDEGEAAAAIAAALKAKA